MPRPIWNDGDQVTQADFDSMREDREKMSARIVRLESDLRQSILESRVQALLMEKVQQERARYREALEKIANQDYRGNRPVEQSIATAALGR